MDYKISNCDIVEEERKATYDRDAVLLTMYFTLCDAIKHDDLELFRLLVDNMAGYSMDELCTLEETYPGEDFVSLLSVCVSHDRETMACLVVKKSDNMYQEVSV